MPNTVIQLKKSSTPSAIPADLANGELAINFADGKLFYKNTTSSIVEISPTILSFGTVNANSTLIVSDTTGDVLTIVPGNNITIVGDAINDKVTIGLADSVGIGTSSPASNLHVVGSVITGKLQHSPVPISKLLTGFDGADSDAFCRIGLSDDASVLAVGAAPWEGATGTGRGGVYIYDWNGSNWIQRGSVLEAADAADNDNFGQSISLNSTGTILAVGARNWEGATGTDRSGVYIYDWNGSSWVQRGSVLEAADAADSDIFGQSVSLSSDGSILAVGAAVWEGATGPPNRGGVYIYDWSGSAWVQRGSVLEAADAADNDQFGQSISLNSTGTILAVGAQNREGATGTDRGGVYIYDWNGSSWVQRGSVLEAADAADSDAFGRFSISRNGSILVVGAVSWEGATGSNRGAVYTYTLTGALPSYSGVATGSGWIEGANSALIARTAGLDRITIDANGNVGIGNTAPSANLHVTSATYPVTLIERTSTTTNEMRSALVAHHTTTADMVDGFGADVSFRIKDSAGVDNEIATFGAIRDGADNSGAFKFMSRTSGTWSEKMRITSAGNVGIGTTTPTSNLNVVGTANITSSLLVGGTIAYQDLNGTSITGQGIAIAAGYLGWRNGIGTSVDTTLFRDNAADIIAQRRTTNPQTYRLYGTYTDASNYERINLTANSSGHYIIGQQAGTGSARPLYLGANNTTVVTVAANGNFGVGTTSPISKLHIVHASASPSTNGLRISDSGGVDSGVTLGRNGSDGYFEILGQNDVYGLRFRTNGTATDRFAVDIGGNVSATGSFSTSSGSLLNGLSTAFYVSYDSGIQFRNTSNGSKSAVQPNNGALNFYTNANNTNFDSSMIRMVIGSNGNVGIGTTTPTQKLSVVLGNNETPTDAIYSQVTHPVYPGSSNTTAGKFVNSAYGTAYGIWAETTEVGFGVTYAGYFKSAGYVYGNSYGVFGECAQPDTNAGGVAYGGYFKTTSSGANGTGSTVGVRIENTGATGASAYGLVVSTVAGASSVVPFQVLHAGSEKMRITSAGNVGIGNTAPISRLTVDTGISVTAGALPYFELYRSGQSHWKLQHLSNGLGIQNSWCGETYRSALVMDDGLGISTQEILRLAYFGGVGAIGVGISAPTAKLTVANGTSPTSQHNYGTYTDASNYERINLTANSSGHYIIGEKAGTGSARPLYLGANNTTVVTVNSDKSVVVKDKLYGRSSIDNVTYSIYEASIDSVYIANDSSRSGIGYPIPSLYIGGLADGRDVFRLNANTIYLGAKTTVFRTQANPNTTNWISGGSFSVTSNPGSDNFAFGIDDNRTYGWLQYWSSGTATNISINPLGGNVGIGTVTPGAKLEVASPGAGIANLRLPGPNVDNNWAGGIRFYSYDATTVRNEIFNSTGGMQFYTANAERMRISAAGLVGIGITSPAYKLEVAGPASFPYNIASFTDGTTRGITLRTSTNGYTNMRLFDGGGRNITITSQPNDLTTADNYLAAIASGLGSGVSLSTAVNIDSQHMTLRARGDIAFYTNLGSTSLLERMRVADNGNIGINTTLPTEKLQVEGNAIINGNLAIGTTTNYNCVFKLNNDIEIATNKVAATNANTQTVISTFSADKYRGGKFTILGKNANDSHITELLLTHNFTNVFYTEYGVVYSNTSLYTVSSSIVSNNVQIILTSALPDIHYDIMENKFVDIGVYDRSQTITLDRSGSIIEIRAA